MHDLLICMLNFKTIIFLALFHAFIYFIYVSNICTTLFSKMNLLSRSLLIKQDFQHFYPTRDVIKLRQKDSDDNRTVMTTGQS